MNRRFDHVIFDFDGTLVDSAPAILGCFREVLVARGIAPKVAIDSTLIGPPLVETLARMTGLGDPAALLAMAAEFKNDYDRKGVFETATYPGIEAALEQLLEAGCHLHIATNKRARPTLLILEHLRLARCFDSVYAIDRCDPHFADKSHMIGAQVSEQALPPQRCCYVGDKREDGLSADVNGLAFYAAGWGYGEWTAEPPRAPWLLISTPKQVVTSILRCH